MISGADYVLYSNDFSEEIITNISKQIKEIYTDSFYEYSEFSEDTSEYFFFENKEEYDGFFNESIPFEEGQYMQLLVSEIQGVDFDITVQKEIKPHPEFTRSEYKAKLACSSIWMYTAVAPDILEKNAFAKTFYSILTQVLSENVSS
tara:strand:+ start:721 stop:1161 length:441 start_codon:yes stop_codon:yes gene_type:complete